MKKKNLKIFLFLTFPIWIIPFVTACALTVFAGAIWGLIGMIIEPKNSKLGMK